MKITILTLFPDMFNGFLGESIIKRAIANKLIDIEIINIRDYKPLFLNNKILFPVILILMYLILYSLLNTYKNQETRIKN